MPNSAIKSFGLEVSSSTIFFEISKLTKILSKFTFSSKIFSKFHFFNFRKKVKFECIFENFVENVF